MSCLALYVQTIMRILKRLLSREMRHNRFTEEISGKKMNVKIFQLSSSKLREVTDVSTEFRSWRQKI